LWLLVAAEAPAPAGVSDQLIIMVGGVITAAIVALGGVLVAIVNSRSKAAAPPPPTSIDEHVLYERTAVLARRADDSDERDEVQDRRLDQLERVLDLDNPEWRHR
jgi:hypothetical protein